MQQTLRNTLAWTALVAWLFASGVSADVLQVVAYADHVASDVEVSARDHCGACKAADAAREVSEHGAPAKHSNAGLKVKPDGAVWSVRLPARGASDAISFREVIVSVFCPELICEVPVPPPKATV